MKKLVLVALNEFDPAFFAYASSQVSLPNIRKLLNLPHSDTWTADKLEKEGLDPWVQWVSIHTGTDSSHHGVKHLGDVPKLTRPQIWEELSLRGISSGIWGAMNASRGRAEQCRFFLPDPWTFSERAFPEELNGLLALPRYYATNYLDTTLTQLLTGVAKLLGFLMSRPRLLIRLLSLSPIALRGLMKFGLKSHLLFSLFDLVSVTTFLHYKKEFQPDFSLVFINSIAHMQHNIWCQEGTLNAACGYTLQVIDRILGQLYEEGSELLVVNALTQRNIANKKKAIVYRQINPIKFLAALGLPFKSVKQLMTNDAHVMFNTSRDACYARNALANATLAGRKLFDVDYDESSPEKLFYQLDFWDELAADAVFEVNGKKYQFYEHFEKLVERTGEHLQKGDVYSTSLVFPDGMLNHKVYDHILEFYARTAA
tara:strand:+ start:85515 stop:86795 length:1281 start_codon:yes stop_codon:yes gene_type:complete